jgi:hypothetical protein
LAHHWKKLWNFKHPPTQIEVTHFYMVLHGIKWFIFFCIYIYTPHFTYLHLHLVCNWTIYFYTYLMCK